MKMDWVPGRNGYDIPVRAAWAGEEQAVIICHGFGSSKASPMVEALMQTLPQHGITAVAFDFPAHGDSPVDGAYLRVPYCIDDLETVEAWVRTILPKASIGYFGSSFGAYITLLRLGRDPVQGAKAFLRSAAVTMPKLVNTWLDQRAKGSLSELGYFVPDYDYVREMRIMPPFLVDLAEHDVFTRYQKGLADLAMVHGAKDSVAPPEDAQRFAAQFGADLLLLPNGEHPLMGEGELEQVLQKTIEFFGGGEK